MRVVVRITGDGTARAIHDDGFIRDALARLGGPVATRRAGYVEPVGHFRNDHEAIARLCAATGAADADELERGHGADWVVDLRPLKGPILGPYRDRVAALAAERREALSLLSG